MHRPLDKPFQTQVPFWRSPKGRAWFFQAAIMAAFVCLALFFYHNILKNLETRGIGSGFEFLKAEAGFRIGEKTLLPLPCAGVVYFLASLCCGLLICRLIAKQFKAAKKPLPLPWLGLSLFAGIGLPFITLYLFKDQVHIARYTPESSYAIALATGLANTLKVAVIGCVASTFLGLFVALGRISPNWLLRTLCRWYVEVNRNLPLLLQLFFWYFIVLQHLPPVRRSLDMGGVIFLNKRGLYLPALVPGDGAWAFCAALAAGFGGAFFLYRLALSRRDTTGRTGPWLGPALGLIIGLPAFAGVVAGTAFTLDFPVLKGFNYQGGTGLTPEFTALAAGLTVYVSAFNAEIIRAGIEAVSRGQREAARAIAMDEGQVMRIVILPQAMRVIIPPMTGEYLAVAKNSSLAVAIGYPDFVSVGGTILNQTGQAVEIVGIWMGVYLCISLAISLGMNIYNARITLKGGN